MSRKRIALIMLGCLVLLFCCSISSADEKQEKITLTYANFPPAPTFPCVQMERWADEVEKRTGGMVEVKTFPGGTLLGAKNMFDGVVDGIADIGNMAMSYQPGRFPVSEAVDQPIGFPSATVASLTLYDLIMYKYQPDEFKDVKIITLFTCPPSNFMTSKPVKKLEDLKGMELRVSGTGVPVIKALGANPVAMPQSETPDAIQKGVVKGIVSSMEILKDFNFAAYCPFVTRQDMHVVTFSVVMNKKKWESLPGNVKQVIDDLRREQALWTGQYVDGHVEEALEWSKKEHDLEIFTFPEEEKKEIKNRLQPLINDYIKRTKEKGLPAEEIMETVQYLKKSYSEKY